MADSILLTKSNAFALNAFRGFLTQDCGAEASRNIQDLFGGAITSKTMPTYYIANKGKEVRRLCATETDFSAAVPAPGCLL